MSGVFVEVTTNDPPPPPPDPPGRPGGLRRGRTGAAPLVQTEATDGFVLSAQLLELALTDDQDGAR